MIEPLEFRIAPATLTGRVVKYIDLDGDAVKVTLTKGTLAEANFVFDNAFATSGPQELQRIDLSGVTDVETSNITVAVKKAATGDGIANIGGIIATGHDLGAVKVKGTLGSIAAGNNAQPAPGLASLTVGSLGLVGTAEQAPGGSSIAGAAGRVKIAGDLGDQFSATSLFNLKIAGSIIGNGRVFVNGDLTKATLDGSIIGRLGDINIYVQGNVGSLMVGRSVLSGTVTSDFASPQIVVEGNAGKITIGGDVIGPTGPFDQASLRVDGTVGSLTIGGSVNGTTELGVIIRLADKVNAFGQGVGSVLIKGSTLNMQLGVSVTFTNSQSEIGSITINGAFVSSGIAVSGTIGMDGKYGTDDDTITASSVINSLTIKGAVYGTSATGDSFAINAGKVVKARISGRVVPLGGGTQTLNIAPSGDVFIRDLV
jgi:hypothetical protein